MSESAGLDAFIQARGRSLYRYAYALCLNELDAQDLVQEALVRTFGIARRIEPESPVAEAYVRTAMLRLFVDSGRRGRRWAAVRHLFTGGEEAVDGPEDRALDGLDIGVALSALGPQQRACVLLFYYEDLPVATVAQRLRISEGNVKRTLSDARAKLRGLLSPEVVTHEQ